MGLFDRLAGAFDGNKFAHNLFAGQLSAKVNDVLEQLGPAKLDALMTTDTDIASLFSEDGLLVLKNYVAQNSGGVSLVLHEYVDDILARLPPWAVAIRKKHGAAGDAWLRRQLEWVEAMASSP